MVSPFFSRSACFIVVALPFWICCEDARILFFSVIIKDHHAAAAVVASYYVLPIDREHGFLGVVWVWVWVVARMFSLPLLGHNCWYTPIETSTSMDLDLSWYSISTRPGYLNLNLKHAKFSLSPSP